MQLICKKYKGFNSQPYLNKVTVDLLMSSIKSPEEAVESCIESYNKGKELIQKGRDIYKSEIVKLGITIFDTINSWKHSIKPHHVFKDLFKFLKTVSIKDYEAHVELFKYGVELLRNVLSDEDIEAIVKDKDDYIKSLYYFLRASMNRALSGALGIDNYIDDLNRAVQYAPGNPVPRYFKALWIEQYAIIVGFDLDERSRVKLCNFLKEAIIEVDRVLNMDKKWFEAENLRTRLQLLVKTKCRE